jgi:hypothetical protein
VIVTDLAGSMGKLLAMWMDRDPQSRRSSIETYLAPDVEFRSPFGQARGYDELEKYSDYLQGKYPGTGFFVHGPVQLIGDYVRLPFVLIEHDGSTVATGQDFLRLAADGRAELMYAFFDE